MCYEHTQHLAYCKDSAMLSKHVNSPLSGPIHKIPERIKSLHGLNMNTTTPPMLTMNHEVKIADWCNGENQEWL